MSLRLPSLGILPMAALGLLLAPPALAQDQTDDIEFRQPDLDPEDGRVQLDAFLETQWHEYNNIDFRYLDESSDQAILDSDDRRGFAFSGIGLNVGYNIDDRTRLVAGLSHRGLWGNDQIGNIDRFGGWLYFNALYAEFRILQDAEHQPRFRIGRQFFEIGGIPGPEFALLDILDMVRIDQPLPGVGTLVLVPIDVPSMSSARDRAYIVDFIGQSDIQTFNFRGDTMTRRHGAVLVADELVEHLDVRAYGFYTDVGALGTGSDISYGGLMGNFSDNDWVANFGARASYQAGPLTPWVTLDGSVGIDRKELVANDVNTNGLAWQAGVDLKLGEDSGLRAQAWYHDVLGPIYQSDGMLYSHGYVGMKGQLVGGTLTSRYMGWRPSSYIGIFGVTHRAHDVNRRTATRVISGRLGYEFGPQWRVNASYWFLQDTGFTRLDMDKLQEIDPPYGYSREEFAAQRRLGEVLGQEVNLDIDFQANDHVGFRLNGAFLLPGPFYEEVVGRVAGTALGSEDPAPAWALNGGMRVRF